MIDMASKQIVPAVISYTKSLADTINAVKAAGADASVQVQQLKAISEKLAQMQSALEALKKADAEGSAMSEGKEQAFFYKDVVKEAMAALREPADELEMMVDKKVWPFPTYADLIFEV